MLGKLNKREIIDLLESQFIGRLGCHLNGETYVVPVNFVYQNNAIYVHSAEGKKIKMLRANPRVCFQIDEIDNMFKWKSVILWGTFEELKGVERQQAMQGLILRIMPNTNEPGEPFSCDRSSASGRSDRLPDQHRRSNWSFRIARWIKD